MTLVEAVISRHKSRSIAVLDSHLVGAMSRGAWHPGGHMIAEAGLHLPPRRLIPSPDVMSS